MGISRDADLAEIKLAYRRLVRRLHPDVCGRNMKNIKRFLEIKDAYAFLSKKRLKAARVVEPPPGERPRVCPSCSGEELKDGAFVFKKVDARECLFGAETEVEITDGEEFCPGCKGLGKTVPKHPRPCPVCSGSGFKFIPWSGEELKVVCNSCNGTGSMCTVACSVCRGRGKVVRQRTVRFRVPRGAKNGTVLELKDQGPWDHARQCRSTLFVEIEVDIPCNMEIRGRDIFSTLRIDCWTYLGGGYVSCETIEGSKEVFIYPEVLREGKLVLEGCGWIDENGSRGDHVFMVELSYPSGPCPRQAAEHIEALKRIWPVSSHGTGAIPYLNVF